MNDPTKIRKILAVGLFLLLFFVSGLATVQATVQAAGKATLTSMEKKEEIGRTRISFFFTELPDFEVERSGQRVDLLLKDVWVSAKLRSLPEDEKVVKILLAQKHRDLLTSLLFRRAPKELHTESKQNPPRIEMDLLWEGAPNSRPGVAFRIKDMPVRKTGKKARELQHESPWQGRWAAFFKEYRTDWKLTLPLQYSLPELPPLVTDQQSSLWPLQQFAAEQQWLSLLRRAGQINGLDPEQGRLRSLLVAEAQLRTSAGEAALARLQQLQDNPGAEAVRVDYLTAYAQALSGQPFVAQLTLQSLLPKLTAGAPLTPFSYLLAAETALASRQYDLALGYLQNAELSWPAGLLPVVELRTADAMAGLEQLEAAVAAYSELENEQGLFENYLFSCNLAAASAYRSGAYPLASRLYRKLSTLIKDQPGADLIQFATGASAYLSGDLDWGIIGLQKASLDWPGLEGGDRAELWLIDHRLNTGDDFAMAKAVTAYGQLGRTASSRAVREESSFKRALGLYLQSDFRASVSDLMTFRRDFGSSRLRREADLLLLEQLPQVVNSLLKQQKELEAVVLVEQNRNLLLRGALAGNFLHDLSVSFENLGLYDRASRVLLFLFDRADGDAGRKPLYLPLARNYLKRGEFGLASDYASRYLKKFPRGADSGALFGVLLDAFEKQGRDEELLAWLGRRNRPHSPELEVRAAWIYWQQQRLDEVVASLERAEKEGGELQVKEMALLAESYYRLGKNSAAEKIYLQLEEADGFASQARYRQAQILLRKLKRGAALNLLTQLVDEDGNSAWGKLAQDLLIQESNRRI